MADEQNTAGEQKNPVFEIIRIYNKDISLETPNSPEVFRAEWKPESKIDLDIRSNEVDKENHVFDITLRLTVTTKIAEDKVAFLCEVNQAALVHIENLQDQQLGHALNATVPSILFPYARENISSLVSKAGFPPFILQPLNFDAIYMQRLQQEARAAQEAPKAAE